LNHARELLRGLNFNSLLTGPDGAHSNDGSYLAQARTFAFRNPVTWTVARSLDILSPGGSLTGIPDDGLLNTGKYGTTNGTVLVPLTGIALTAQNPYGSGTVTTARYFVKVADNNGEASELAKDASNNPFVDGDGIVIVRSQGIAQTVREVSGSTVRRNSVAVFEARFKHSGTFDLDAPLVVEGNQVNANFDGNAFGIDGGDHNPGIGTIDANTGDGIHPDQQITSVLKSNQRDNIDGMGLNPSIVDITAMVNADPDKALLRNPNYLWDFVNNKVPRFADYSYQGNQHWAGGNAPYLGHYDTSKPPGDPSQDMKVTYVNGDLEMNANMTGAGLLVVTGSLKVNGSLTYYGLVLVIGTGDVDGGGLNRGIYGGMFVANVTRVSGTANFGTPIFSMSGNSNITINSETISLAVGLIPPSQLSFREITSSIDP
jgi:hypothetical protein